MVRATAAEVVKLFPSGEYPAGWSATSVGNLCQSVDYELDAFELSTSDNEAIRLANLLVYRYIIHSQWSATREGIEPVIWTKDMYALLNRLSDEGSYEFVTYVDGVEDDPT